MVLFCILSSTPIFSFPFFFLSITIESYCYFISVLCISFLYGCHFHGFDMSQVEKSAAKQIVSKQIEAFS